MYLRCLKQILEPLGIYDLENGAGAVELEVIGKQMDEIFDEMETLATEVMPLNASGFGLEKYEAALPYRPSYLTVADRRRAVMALLRIRNGCFTQGLLQDTISGCGIEASIEESNTAQTVKISFPQCRGVPENFESLKDPTRTDSTLSSLCRVLLYILHVAGAYGHFERLVSCRNRFLLMARY